MLKELGEKYPLIREMVRGVEVLWLNPNPDSEPSPEVTDADIADAGELFEVVGVA